MNKNVWETPIDSMASFLSFLYTCVALSARNGHINKRHQILHPNPSLELRHIVPTPSPIARNRHIRVRQRLRNLLIRAAIAIGEELDVAIGVREVLGVGEAAKPIHGGAAAVRPFAV